MAKNYSVVVIDLSEHCEPYIDAIRTISQLVLSQIVLSRPKELVAVFLAGSEDTNNELQAYDDYENISLVHPFAPLNVASIRSAKSFDTENFSVDLLSALVVADDLLATVGTPASEKSLYFISPFQSDVCRDKFDDIRDRMTSSSVDCHFVNVSLQDKEEIESDSTFELFSKISEACGGSVYSITSAIGFFKLYQKKWTFRVDYKGNLDIGADSLGIKIFSRVKELKLPSRSSTSVDTFERSIIEDESGFRIVPESSLTKIKRDIITFDPKNPSLPLDEDSVVKGYFYGTTPVAITAENQSEIKGNANNAMKNVRLIGFVKKAQISRFLFMEGCDVMIPETNRDATSSSALHASMIATRMCMLLRIVKRANSMPALVAAIPLGEGSHRYYLLHKLPYNEDIRPWQFDPLPETSGASVDIVSDLIDVLMLDDDDYRPGQVPNPSLNMLYAAIRERALGNVDFDAMPEFDLDMVSLLQPNSTLFSKAQPIVEKLFAECPVSIEEDSGTSKRRNKWSDSIKEVLFEKSKKPRVEDETRVEISLMILKAICRTLGICCDRVDDFLVNSIGTCNFNRAIRLLTAMRKSSIENGDTDVVSKFNEFLKHLKTNHSSVLFKDFFRQMKNEGILLISTDDLPVSQISLQESQSFLADYDQDEQTMEEVGTLKIEEDDDLLDLL
ncbi:hypothetical protein GEMRC1_003331 [Eukaryota sp. GEM-RC1]